MPIRTFAYGLLEPITNAKLVHDQMWLAHRYHNVLVEIEHERRQKAVAAMAAHVDVAPIEQQIAELEPVLEAAKQVILRTRAASRSRSDTAAQRQEVKDLSSQLRELRAERKAARKAIVADPNVRAALDAADEGARERVRQARKVCGVYWGTYLLHEADLDRSRQSRMRPKFASWNGHIAARRVSVQLQGGLELDKLWGGDTQIQIVPGGTHGRRWDGEMGTTLRMRIGSANRAPIWAEWPAFIHRPLPEGSTIKVATVSCYRRSCIQWVWTLHLTVDTPTSIRGPAGVGNVALNLGFCQRPGGDIRSGYVVGDDGHEEEVLLPARDIEAFDKADSIRSFRDKNMDAMRAQLMAWRGAPAPHADNGRATPEVRDHSYLTDLKLDATTAARRLEVRDQAAVEVPQLEERVVVPDSAELSRITARSLPDWFRDKAQYLHAWRSPERFRSLAFAWHGSRFEDDAEGFRILDEWRHRDEHLDQYENGLRRGARLRRRERYRVLAARLAAKYHTIVIDDTNLSTLQRSPKTESTDVNILAVKHQQRLAAGSELRSALLNAFDGRVVKLTAVDMTIRHESCSHVDRTWDRTEEMGRSHTCPSCGVTFDQDFNHCRNLLRERSSAVLNREAARSDNTVISKPTRQQRLRSPRAPAPE
jgi:hypothetical protein